MKKLRLNTQYIDFYLQQHKITKKEFCNRCGIEISTLNSIYQQRNISIEKIIPITDFLKITTDTFLFLEKRRTSENANS